MKSLPRSLVLPGLLTTCFELGTLSKVLELPIIRKMAVPYERFPGLPERMKSSASGSYAFED